MADSFAKPGDLRFTLGEEVEYDPAVTNEIDRRIRHLPAVKAQLVAKAIELRDAAGSDDFDIVLSDDPEQQRPRAYVAPSTDRGIHLELAHAVLLKAALGMTGQ